MANVALLDWTQTLHLGRNAALAFLVTTLAACSGSGATPTSGDEAATDDGAQAAAEPEASEPEAETVTPVAKPAGGGALAQVEAFIAKQTIDKSDPTWKQRLPKPTVATFAEGETYFWHLKTNMGPIKVRLMSEVAPMHVTSTIYLTQLGFYDDIVFHRVIKNFMAQGGCPLGEDPDRRRRGTGGPGYKYDGEFDPKVVHDRPGLLSMANAGPGTDGSQFFLTFVKTAWLDGKHTIFGEVIDGMETVRELEKRGSADGTTSERLVIEKATILTE